MVQDYESETIVVSTKVKKILDSTTKGLSWKSTDEAIVVGNEVLIGQVILEKLDLLVDCKNQKLIPNPANPNYPVAMIK